MFRIFRKSSARADNFKEAPLLDHLEELRLRIIYALLFWAMGSVAAYAFRERIRAALEAPLQGFIAQGGLVDVIAQRVTEPMVTTLMISMFGGLVLALPCVVYQLWAFIAPGLTREERRWGGPFILGLGFSFALGVVFAYFVILPYALPFLLNFLPGLKIMLSFGQYITDVVTYLGIFGLVFELPITMFLLAKVGLVTASFLATYRRHAILAIVAASALITPTVDPVNLALMAVPLIVLYEFGILLARLARRVPKPSLVSSN